MSLRNKAIKGFSWSLFEGLSSQGVTFIVGIFLARILSPLDFGIVGLMTVFIAISTSIVGSGFSEALIRKNDVTDVDYSTVFYLNIVISLFIYLVLFLVSPFIANYFNEEVLVNLIRVAGLVVIVGAFTLVQRAILTKKLNFELQAKISLVSSVISAVVALILAYRGFGVWSLVALTLIRQFLICLFLWMFNNWRPILVFSMASCKELFGYSYKLLVADLLNTLYSNIYYVIIGKVFSPTSLGYYTRADGFQRPFSSNIGLGLRRISFPVLSQIQDDVKELKNKFIFFLRVNILISSVIMFFLMTIAKPMILLLIGDKWVGSIFYTQLLCIPGLLYGIQVLNLNLLIVKGYSNLFLKLEVVKKVILIPLVIISSFFSMETMLYCFVLFSFIELFINSFYNYKIIQYSFLEQLKDIFPFVSIGFVSFVLIYPISLLSLKPELALLIQISLLFIYYIIVFKMFKFPEFNLIKELTYKIFKKIR